MKKQKSKDKKPEIPMSIILEQANQDKEDQQSIDPGAAMRAISMFLTDPSQIHPQQKDTFSPHARIILLTILLCSTVFYMYKIFYTFLDTIVLAVLSGVSYVRLREAFVTSCKRPKNTEVQTKTLFHIFKDSVIYGLLILVIPWIRYEFSDDSTYNSWKQLFHLKINPNLFQNILTAFSKTNNIIRLVQFYLLIQILINIFGKWVLKFTYWLKGALTSIFSKVWINRIFFILFLFGFCIILIIVAGIFFEFSSLFGSAGKAIEKYNNCTFYDLDNQANHIQQCTEVISGSLKPYIPSIKDQKEVTSCIGYIQTMERKYLNITALQHKKQLCLVYQILKEHSPQVIDHFLDIQVTKEYLLTILQNILKLVSMTSDTIFSMTTFISILMVTIKSYTAAEQNFSIFGQGQNQLVSQISHLMFDYIMVTIKHLVLSLILFQIFRFSDFNIILSILIAAITLFPLLSVTFIMIIFSFFKYFLTAQGNYMAYLSTIICLLLFNYGSSRIFKDHLTKLDFNNTLISLSAVFGLYTFGVAGVFYGPLVILLFRCAYQALGKSKV